MAPMYAFVTVLGIGFVVLALSEVTRRRLHVPNEDARKTYHIVHALIVGIAPFLISYTSLIVLELLLLAAMILVRRYKLFTWLYQVGRLSWGEYFGVAGVVLIALLQPNKWVFLAAMLHLGIADAAAALIGKRYGQNSQFRVFGQIKSLQGSLAFLVASLVIMALVIVTSQSNEGNVLLLGFLPLLMTLAEMASPFGTDNFVIPVGVVLLLNSLRFAA